ncbi:glycosyl hydrolase family 47-domain-containing protein [Podospora didyma]|uniref:alpha-1,2-Mannosidase n=1 Tax=Podospora didyma TaxID=330526 RepID=A0AAE0NP24_9PEZI|nr:glycosyl hydrolase family 47-domain-containing protein [Podospora didyma]
MFRFRRYRIFVICAFVLIFILFHVSKNSQWEERLQSAAAGKGSLHAQPNPDHGNGLGLGDRPPQQQQQPPPPVAQGDAVANEPIIKIPQLKTANELKGGYGLPTTAPTKTRDPNAKEHYTARPNADSPPPVGPPADGVPERKLGAAQGLHKGADGAVLANPGDDEISTTTSTIHWEKPTEFFPVPKESLIALPSGRPKSIPTVQFAFEEEKPAAKAIREARLAKVKSEAQRAWSGYKQFAWTHDEVKPISKTANDPFCGWAATLVDALDTLWIMGLKEEFDDAVKAVKEIDFTTTPYRQDIPVFETIIRYLGGLLGAYDVTGGHTGGYDVLLDKAIELAEILMGVFDTPNRMPILYYRWQPAYTSSPKRAATDSGVAELGSMSMEFTRLAQLTGNNKYYDAVARITNALEELQNQEDGSALPGIFPEKLDASGCNMTAPHISTLNTSSDIAQKQADEAADLFDPPHGYQSVIPPSGQPKAKHATDGVRDLDFQVEPRDPAARQFRASSKRADAHVVGSAAAPFSAKGRLADWDCTPQGLTGRGYSGSYSMGGSQDSAYEYFPKQFILLGGLEPKYRTMYEKTVAAVKKSLLFRPMVEKTPDILFSAKVLASDSDPKTWTYSWEVTHLTCFLGGMFGLGGKLFGSAEDVLIGEKLSAGCAWAYEIMPSGVMPERATVMPCSEMDECHWNKTAWFAQLDPQITYRETEMEEYYTKKTEWKDEVERLKKQDAFRYQEAEKRKHERAKEEAIENEEQGLRPLNHTLSSGTLRSTTIDSAPIEVVRDLKGKDNSSRPIRESGKTVSTGDLDGNAEKAEKAEDDIDLDSDAGYEGHPRQESSQRPISQIDLPLEPIRPLTHQEYVEERIRKERIPPGFARLDDPRYILRPEAIESVWYMYRITGNPSWQETGWRMFESIIELTQTEHGHSAIQDVTSPDNPQPADSEESFWLAETLKYFYLLFTTPDVISLDEYVLNTEAHPFKRPT